MSVGRTPTGISVTYKDNSVRDIPFTDADGKVMSQKDFIVAAGPLLAGQIDVKTAVDKGAYNPKGVFNAKDSYTSTVKVAKGPEPIETIYAKHVDSVVNINDIKGKTEEQAQVALMDKLSGLGMTVEQTGFNTDEIYIVNGNDEKSPTVDIKSNPADAIKILKDWIKTHPTGKTVKDKTNFLNGLKKSGIIGSTTGELD